MRDERADAEQKASGYIDVARAVLPVSASDAAAYFNQAVEVSSKIGDENLARWDSLIDLALRAANRDRPAPVVAYKFARCAEVSYDYVVRDKHFAWEDTVDALTGLCPSSSVAIMSRWRDRQFGELGRILPVAMRSLCHRGSVNPIDVVPFICFRAGWREQELLEPAIQAATATTRSTVAAFVFRYMSLETQSEETWQGIKTILDANGIVLPGLNELAAAKKEKPRRSQSPHGNEQPSVEKPKRDWDAIFYACDLSSANDISVARQRFRSLDPPYYTEEFFEQACSRIAPGKEPELIRALADVADFNLYDLRNFLEKIPASWKGRIAVTAALAHTLKAFCRRFCMSIVKSREYEVLPFDLACELSGADEAEIVDVVLAAIGESPELAGPRRLFSLVGLLTVKLSKNEALSVLSYGLDLFDAVLEDRDGDGPWTDALSPPKKIEEALAGYIWAGLASPHSAIRWEAAHAVVGLCALGRTEIIAALIDLADADTGQMFVDARLHFYNHHARQWLLVALSRAALDHGAALVPHKEFFIRAALSSQPHVLIRAIAARIALKLNADGLATVSSEIRDALANVNASPFAPVAEDARSKAAGIDEAKADGDDRYYFGIDFGPYWLAPLGRCFAKFQAEVEQEALRVIRVDWGISGRNRWDNDERARQGQFRHETTRHSHGSYPRTDDLSFYLSYHAMMVAAGRLLATSPLRQRSADDYEDGFAEWLSRHDISRLDARWLSDRRDPVPLDRPEWINEESHAEWRWSVRRDDFERVLSAGDGWINVRGRWSQLDSNREESLAVHSALASPDRSQALLRALQTALDPHDYRVPDADDDLQIDEDGFQFKGWIIDRTHERGMDHLDPWAGSVSYGPPSPAPEVVDRFGLRTDADRRIWHIGNETNPVMASQVWGFLQEKDDQRERPSGRRLQASLEFVVEFLRSIGMDLIIEVEIQRRIRHQPYEAGDDDRFEYIPPYSRIFLIRTDGEIYSL